MITASFYVFSKKVNSTAQPTAGSGTDIQCVLKEASSLLSPRLQLTLQAVPNYNYVSMFGRFYYVDDWTYVKHSLWECSLTCDILASFKTEIGASSLYVLRSSAASDGTIIDKMYPAKSNSTFQTVSAVSPFVNNVQAGSYVVGIASGNTPGYGSITYFVMDGPMMQYLSSRLNSDFITNLNGFSLNDASWSLQKALVNPFSYITSCIWFPVDFGDMPAVGQSGQAIEILGIDTGATGYYMSASSPMIDFTLSWQIPDHPQAAARGMYVNAAYRKLVLEIPPFGCVELDPSIAANYTHITASINIDCASGRGCIRIGAGNTAGTITELMEKYEGMAGVPMQLSSVYRDTFGTVTKAVPDIIGAAAGMLTGNFGSAIMSGGSAVGNAIETLKPRMQSLGGQGSFASYAGSASLYVQFIPLADEDLSHVGRPLCQNRLISSIPGFIQVLDGDIPLEGFTEEASYIKRQLEAGFFYE